MANPNHNPREPYPLRPSTETITKNILLLLNLLLELIKSCCTLILDSHPDYILIIHAKYEMH